MPSPKKPVDQDEINVATKRLAETVSLFADTVVRKLLKKRSHRAPPDKDVALYLRALLIDNYFVKFVSNEMFICLRSIESQLGKQSKNWSLEERLNAFADVEWHFHEIIRVYDPPRGRPELNEKSGNRGLINNVIRDATVNQRKQRKDELKRLESSFINSINYTKLGQYAKNERDELLKTGQSKERADCIVGSIDAVFNYMKEWDVISESEFDARIIPEEIQALRLSPGQLQDLLKNYGIDEKEQSAFKKRISRRRQRY